MNLQTPFTLPQSFFPPPGAVGTANIGSIPMGAGVGYSGLPYSSIASQLGGGLPTGASVGLGDLPYAAAGASGGGGSSLLSGLLGRIGISAPEGGGSILPGVAEGAGLGSKLIPAAEVAAPAFAGFTAANFVPGGESAASATTRGALRGAGIGGTIGLLGGPLDVVSAPTGAAIGGVVGGGIGLLQNLFGDDGKPSPTTDPRAILAQSAQSLGLNPSNYTSTYDVLAPYAKDDASKSQLAQQLAGQMIQDRQTQQAQAQAQSQALQQQSLNQHFALTLQSQAAQFFQPYANNIITSGITQANALQGMAHSLPPQYRDVMLNQAQMALGDSQRMASAYAMQTSLAPLAFAMQAGQSQAQQSANVDYRNALAQQAQAQAAYYQQRAASGAGGTGSSNFSQIANQLVPSGG